jgi:outer membrane protein TolC
MLAIAPPLGAALAVEPSPQDQPGGETLSLDTVLSEVLRRNPSLQAAQANWQAAKQRVPQARAWEDPRAGVDVERSGTTRFDTFTDNEWMVSQEIPISGKNRLRGQAATAEAAGAFIEVHRRELDLAARARGAYFRLANAFAQRDLTQKNLDLWQAFTAEARSKYELGTQSQADVLVAETERGRIEESLYDIDRQLADARSDLNVLMNRPPISPLGRPAPLQAPALPGTLEDLQRMALAHRPDLLILQKRLEAAKTRVTLAGREWFPDPEIRVEARQFNGTGKFIQEYDTGIFFKVPWVNPSKYRAAKAEARSMVESLEHELQFMQSETLGMIRNQLTKIQTLHHHYELFHAKLVPLAWETVESKRRSYESDKAPLLDLLSAQRTAREAESAMQQHLADYLTARAELEAMVGGMGGPTGSPKN